MNVLPPEGSSDRQRDQAINDLINGRSNAAGLVTLTPGAGTTTVAVKNGNRNAHVLLSPRTAAAAAETATTYAVMADARTILVTHAINVIPGRDFSYIIKGG